MSKPDRLLYSRIQTMRILNISNKTLYKLVKLGELRPVKLCGKTLFPVEDLRALIKRKIEQGQLKNTTEITARSVESRRRSGPCKVVEADEDLLEGLGL
jgi:excisionase family DNA binding protein